MWWRQCERGRHESEVKKKKKEKPSPVTYTEITKILSELAKVHHIENNLVAKQALLNDTDENADWTDSPFRTLFDLVIPLLRFNSQELTRDLKICV